jgi:hypothetical protein
MANLKVSGFGLRGVNVDKNPLELEDNELTQAQNTISGPSAGLSGSGSTSLRKRPGLIAFNTTNSAGVVLGGINVPLINLSGSGSVAVYIGRGPLV